MLLFIFLALDCAGYFYQHTIPGLAAAVIALVLAIVALVLTVREGRIVP